MIIFIHDIGASKSFWLPQIRGIFSLDKTYSDQQLLDMFTLSIPGHNTLDKSFKTDDIKKEIDAIYEEKAKKQENLANKLLLTHNQEIISSLKTEKIIFVGEGLGGVLAIQYSLYKPDRVGKMVLISCGDRFNSFWVKLRGFRYRTLFRLSTKFLKSLYRRAKSPRKKNLYYLVFDNAQRKGLKSAFRILKNYNFVSSFKKISLAEQLEFINIPILTINGQLEFMSNAKNSKKLKMILNPSNPIFKAKKTIIAMNQANFSNIHNREYKWVGIHPQDKDLVSFVFDVRRFLSF